MLGWKVMPPKDGDEFFERMTKSLFTAGLNWKIIENKWPSFGRAFSGFAAKVSRFSEKQTKVLMQDTGM